MKREMMVMAALAVSLSATQAMSGPVGYPYMMWSELSYGNSSAGTDEGVKFDGYAEQGINWVKFGNNWKLNTFVGLRGTVNGNDDEPWNNKWGPHVGVKLTSAGSAPGGGWSDFAIGVRGEHYEYLYGGAEADNRLMLFLQWGAGGDWKHN